MAVLHSALLCEKIRIYQKRGRQTFSTSLGFWTATSTLQELTANQIFMILSLVKLQLLRSFAIWQKCLTFIISPLCEQNLFIFSTCCVSRAPCSALVKLQVLRFYCLSQLALAPRHLFVALLIIIIASFLTMPSSPYCHKHLLKLYNNCPSFVGFALFDLKLRKPPHQ